MGAAIKLSTKGQVVIPKDIRDALQLKAGEKLIVTREGRRIILEATEAPRERISYADFKRRVPPHKGPPVAVENMRDLAAIFADGNI